VRRRGLLSTVVVVGLVLLALIGLFGLMNRRAAPPGPEASLAPTGTPTIGPPTATSLPAPTPTPATVGAVPQAIAPDFDLAGTDGAMHRLSRWRGRPVLLNFWATWCPPCRGELPALQAVSERYAGRIAVIGIAVGETTEQVAPFIAQYGLTYPVLLDLDGNVTQARYAIRGLPTTLFITAEGVVSARHIGPLGEADIDRYLAPLLTPAP